MGREGEGPGEMLRPRGLAVVDGVTFAITHHGRMAAWSSTGELLQDIRLATTHPHLGLDALDDGTLVVSYVVSPDSPSDVIDNYMPQIVAGYDVDPTGRIYVTDGATYDIVAIDADGSKPWHLSVDLPPDPWTDEDTDEVMAGLRIPGTVSDFSWPSVRPCLLALKVDGHGHLYVYRYIRRYYNQDYRIVDVFDRDGRHLFSGTHDAVPWRTTRGDLVYAIADDEDSGGDVVVAYRLIEPFE